MRWPAVFAVLAVLAGCGENVASAPFDGLPLDGDFTVQVDAPVADIRLAGATLSPRYILHAVDPAQGTLITANADPVGELRWVFH